jgi:hypothetical protein
MYLLSTYEAGKSAVSGNIHSEIINLLAKHHHTNKQWNPVVVIELAGRAVGVGGT